MGAHNFKELKRHVGHEIVCAAYGKGFGSSPGKVNLDDAVNVAVECVDCQEVLFDFNRDEEEE